MSPVSVPPALLRPAIRQLRRRVLSSDLPWDVQRQRLDKFLRASPPARGATSTGRQLGGVAADVVTAAGSGSPERTVVHFHGGGYCVSSAAMARTWAAQLSARTGCQVVLPEYRLAPEHPFPAALDDARTVLAALASEVPLTSIVLSGDSAGAGLALSLLLALRDGGAELPAGCVLLSPWLDLTADRRTDARLVRRDILLNPAWLEACAAAYAGRAKLDHPAISPLLAAHDGLPPLLIQAGSDEVLAPDAERLAASASAAGVDVTCTRWPGMWHDFALQADLLAAARSALTQTAWFITNLTGQPG